MEGGPSQIHRIQWSAGQLAGKGNANLSRFHEGMKSTCGNLTKRRLRTSDGMVSRWTCWLNVLGGAELEWATEELGYGSHLTRSMGKRDEVFMLTGFHEVGMEKGKLFQVTLSLENDV